jgi:hypothetical protein
METNDKSLLRCTVKKSADVVKKLVMYAAYAIVVITVLVIMFFGAFAVWAVVEKPLEICVSFLLGIPWYYYVGVVALAAIPVYSLLWCVARELTHEDWKSDEAKNIAFALALTGALALIGVIAFAFALALAFAFESKVLLFFGAYLHYRKRVKA